MFLKQLDQFILQYHPFKVENIAKQQKCRELSGNIRNTRDVTFFNKDEVNDVRSFLSSYFTIHGIIYFIDQQYKNKLSFVYCI
jgi:hypothetical protein